MNIALVILHADPRRGGAERYTIDLATTLATRDCKVTLISSAVQPQKSVARYTPGVPYTEVILQASGLTRARRYERFLRSVEWHTTEQCRYDIVHAMLPVRRCDVYHPHAGLAADAVATGHEKYSGLTRAISAISNRFNRRRQKFAAVERELLEAPNGPTVLCLSEYIKATVRSYYPALPDARLATLFNAVDLKKFDPNRRPDSGREVRAKLKIGDDKIVALIIAQDFSRKGLREAMQAVSLTRDPRIVLVVVGQQPSEPYRRMAIQFGVKDRVIFAGRTDDPYAFYRAADFFVLPTRHDPCSLVVLESLAMGVPVISTIFNGACEIMTSGTHGFVLEDAKKVEPLARAMDEMADDTRRRAMAAACFELRTRLSFDNHVDRLIGIYQNCPKLPS